ncbi:hypothetical protein BDV12DRAFT_204700 [Aspergillus spectabilis]
MPWLASALSRVYESEDAAGGGIIRLLGHLGARVYIVVMLELIIKRNELLPGITEWTFGQVLAISMLIGPVIELLSLILGMGKPNADGAPLGDRLFVHLVLSVFDLAINAGAGTAAAATGAHINGNALTAEMLRLGALGDYFLFAGSSFGSAVLATSIIAERSLGNVPDAVLIAAATAGAPLSAGTVAVTGYGPLGSMITIGFDSLSGYTFARVAQNYGFQVCQYESAAAAGAVFGVLVWFMNLPLVYWIDSRRESMMMDQQFA